MVHAAILMIQATGNTGLKLALLLEHFQRSTPIESELIWTVTKMVEI